ncbi:MAG TPA: carboxypeptidase-like regulatory domain-containing protein [Gemmatimonadales bacterium]|nr:carboxypeptidase-like regulatory domain-containing protein [Gemmatimonadales bacterium]
MSFTGGKTSRFRASLAALICGIGACGGCGDGAAGLNGPSPSVAHILISPAAAAMEPGQFQSFVADCLDSTGKTVACPTLAWTATGGAISASGSFTAGTTAGNFTVTASANGLLGTATVVVVPPGSGPVIAVVPTAALQTMTGWEATAQAGQDECDPVAFANYRNPLYDRVVTELGINRLRLPVRSGAENPTDHYADLLAGRITRAEWRTVRYAAINDNTSPTSVNAAGFHFTELDYYIDNVVTPIRTRLLARGEQLYVNLNFTDFSTQGAGTLFHKQAPAEYAEFLLAAFQLIQSRDGWTPDAVELVLEPDNAQWTGAQIGQALVAAGDRLAAAGYRPDFIAPSNANMGGAITYFDQLIAVPRATQYLPDLAYHRYGGVSTGNLQTIGARAQAAGIRTSMLEHIGSGYQDLHQDLTLARNSSWQQFILGWCGTGDNGGTYYPIDVTTPTAPVILVGSRPRYLQQYFRDVRLGAVRYQATSTSGTFEPLAFRNTSGRWTVVVKANAGGSFSVTGLPAGSYGVTYTTATEFRTARPAVTLAAGQPLVTSIPATGVLTIAAQ